MAPRRFYAAQEIVKTLTVALHSMRLEFKTAWKMAKASSLVFLHLISCGVLLLLVKRKVKRDFDERACEDVP